MRSRVAVEIGGTFTDLVWRTANGDIRCHKVLSTPSAPHEGALAAVDEASVALNGVDEFAHGSTIATNAVLTRRGVRTGLIVTEGFRDLLEIARHDRLGSVYELMYRKPEPLVPRRWVREVNERLLASGEVLRTLDEPSAIASVEALVAEGIESLAVCLLHSYRDATHERAVERIARRWPELFVTTSSDVCPEFREYERAVTTVINAYIGPIVSRYVTAFSESLRKRQFAGALLIMQSSGGILPATGIARMAVRTLLSGPAAGVQGARWFAARAGLKSIITLDMGGTSTDVSLVRDSTPDLRAESMFDGFPVHVPMLDIVTVGAGGGSIAWQDSGGFLRVGPQSAGAQPGPACYGFGGEHATVTDAHVVAGILRPTQFLGGRMTLHVDRATRALAALAGGSVARTAESILRIANANMAAAVRLVSTERGVDPRDYVLVAYGGAGPLHAAFIAEELDIGRVLIPHNPGLVSAFGLLATDPAVDWVQTDVHSIDDMTLGPVRVEALRKRADELSAMYGLNRALCDVAISLDMRYPGQAYELTVPVIEVPQSGAGLRRMFDEMHAARYGWAQGEKRAVQAVNYRLRIIERSTEGIRLGPPRAVGAPSVVRATIAVGGVAGPATFVNRAALPTEYRLHGPAVIEEETATTFVPTGWQMVVLPGGDILLERR